MLVLQLYLAIGLVDYNVTNKDGLSVDRGDVVMAFSRPLYCWAVTPKKG